MLSSTATTTIDRDETEELGKALGLDFALTFLFLPRPFASASKPAEEDPPEKVLLDAKKTGSDLIKKEFDEEGKLSDGMSGMRLSYFGARYYDAEIGVWTSVDPVDRYFDTYSYCGGDPTNQVDPDGRDYRNVAYGSNGFLSWDTYTFPAAVVSGNPQYGPNVSGSYAGGGSVPMPNLGFNPGSPSMGTTYVGGNGRGSAPLVADEYLADFYAAAMRGEIDRNNSYSASENNAQKLDVKMARERFEQQREFEANNGGGGGSGGLSPQNGAVETAFEPFTGVLAGVALAGIGVVRGVAAYQVDRYIALKMASTIGDDLAIHHVGQAAVMEQLIPGYVRATAPSIVLPELEHYAIPTIRGVYTGTARSLLARDIRNLRVFTSAPNDALETLIGMNKTMYPGSFAKVR